MLPSALALALFALRAHADVPAQQLPAGASRAAAEAADVVWRYDTGG